MNACVAISQDAPPALFAPQRDKTNGETRMDPTLSDRLMLRSVFLATYVVSNTQVGAVTISGFGTFIGLDTESSCGNVERNRIPWLQIDSWGTLR